MNKNAQQWVAALRSGDYQQGRDRLARIIRDDERVYCCLGVACHLYKREVGDLEESIVDGGINYDGATVALPSKVMEWLGLDDPSGHINATVERGDRSLSEMNDDGSSFEEIADVIESEPGGLFRACS